MGQMTSSQPTPFSALIVEHHRALLVYARALTGEAAGAEDVVQDAFVIAHRKFAEFDAGRDFGAWMRGIVRLKARDWRRKNRRGPLPEGELEESMALLESWETSRAEGTSSVFEALESCLDLLPARLAEAVRSYYYQAQNGTDAAEGLGITDATLRKRLERARAQLHACLSRKLALPNSENSSTPTLIIP